MKMYAKKICAAILAAGLFGCASQALEKRLDERLSKESSVNSRKDLDEKTKQLAISTPGLSPAQRAGLAALKADLQARLSALNKESLKLRTLLIQDVLASDYNSSEIGAVKTRLRKNSKQRVEAFFEAINKANDLLGRSALIQEAMDLQSMQDDSENF